MPRRSERKSFSRRKTTLKIHQETKRRRRKRDWKGGRGEEKDKGRKGRRRGKVGGRTLLLRELAVIEKASDLHLEVRKLKPKAGI